MSTAQLLYEGKAKRIFATDDPEIVRVEYKNDATAFNGAKKGQVANKGMLNNKISSKIFQLLATKGIENHFVEQISDTEQLIKRVRIVLVEVVVRNIAAGSLAKRLGIAEGMELKRPIVEFYYKNDDLNDPLINDEHVDVLELATTEQITDMKRIGFAVNDELRALMLQAGVILVDFKLEFGVDGSGKIILADEISPDTCRFWDVNTREKLDKDRFRQDLGGVTEAYQEILKRLEERL